MGLADWLSLISICLLGALSPGPSLMVILAYTSEKGREAGVLASVGHGLGVFIYALAAASGLSYLLTHYQSVFLGLQLLGAALLLWLVLRIARATFIQSKIREQETENINKSAALHHAFRDGFLIAVLNPKIAAFFISLFSQFLDEKQQLVVHFSMAGLAGFIDMAVYLFYAVIASTALVHKLLERYARLRDGIFAAILISLALSLFTSHLQLIWGIGGIW